MKYLVYTFSLLITLILASCGTKDKPVEEVKDKKVKKAVFIIVDGIPADVIERINTPVLDSIAAKGGYTRAIMGGEPGHISESPTISAVGYNTLLSSTWSHKHNVYGNGIKAPNYNYWNIFRVMEAADSSVHSAVFSTWLDNRTKLVGDGLLEAGSIKIDYGFDGFEHDTVRFPHLPDRKFIKDIDELVSTEAGNYIAEKGPDISWVYLEFTDDMGHKFGDSPEQEEAVILADEQVGRIWDAIQKREAENNEEWMILITTDHGRKPEGGFGHGGQSERERTIWFTTNVPNLNERYIDMPNMTDGLRSMLRFLEVELPEAQKIESDGVPFIGEISLGSATGILQGDSLTLTWKAYQEEGNVEVSYTNTNHFQKGGKDEYSTLGSVPLANGSMDVDLSQIEGDTIKFLLKGKSNMTNYWFVRE